jgi:maltokinase
VSDDLVAASYATDEPLLTELREAWPPGPSPLRAPTALSPEAQAERGYVGVDLRGRPPGAAIRIGDRFAVAFVPDGDAWLSVPMAGFGGRWWRAEAGDGLSAFAAGVPAASERPLGVDQTNVSVVVGERAIVKWFRRIGPGPTRAASLLAHLHAVGFDAIPQPLGFVTWRRPGGTDLAVAQGDAFLPAARDGWDWALERLERGEPDAARTGRQLGALVAALHEALAVPSALIPDPVDVAGPAAPTAWHAAAVATFDEALVLTDDADGDALRRLAPAMRADLEGIAADRSLAIQPIHGDLHVGQILEWPGGLAVIDFDGNPAIAGAAADLRQPVERDLAQMLTSLDHVGRIVERRRDAGSDAAVAVWIPAAREAFLDAYGECDRSLLAAFEVEQECRELVYAARFLPRWRHAPLATLRARYER